MTVYKALENMGTHNFDTVCIIATLPCITQRPNQRQSKMRKIALKLHTTNPGYKYITI